MLRTVRGSMRAECRAECGRVSRGVGDDAGWGLDHVNDLDNY